MKVEVQYLGYIRQILNKGREAFVLNEGARLLDLLNKMARLHGEQFQTEVFEPGQEDVNPGFVITVNGVLTGRLHGLDTPLKTGDSVILMTLVSGG